MTDFEVDHSVTTAAVEALTAEVRVLMVGSRQVTMSVFRQLDHVNPGSLQPMGRVNDRPLGQVHEGLWLVGSCDGALARSFVRRYDINYDQSGFYTACLALPLIVLAGLR